jgi:MFS family permease
MKRKRLGLGLFWLGAAYIFGASWLAMWWVAPVWRNTPAEPFEGTIWAFGGPIFMAIALSVPVGLLLIVIGILLYAGAKPSRVTVFAIGATLVALSMLFVPTLGYYPVFFGLSGGLILLLFLAVLWYWARNRRALDAASRTSSDLQMASYVFFFVAASMLCTTLGNPFSGLYFPDKVLRVDALPWHYSFGTKIVVYFVLGFLFNLLSQYLSHQNRRKHSAIL